MFCQKLRYSTHLFATDKTTAWLYHKSGTKRLMKIGYARVSTEEQNPDLQLDALKAAGCEKIFIDTANGADVKRVELTKCLMDLGSGDTLIVWKLDRLGRLLHPFIECFMPRSSLQIKGQYP